MSFWKIISSLLLFILRIFWASVFGKRNRALIPVEADRTIVKVGDVVFDLPFLRSFGLDEMKRTVSFSDGRSVIEVMIDDITELSLIFVPKEKADEREEGSVESMEHRVPDECDRGPE